jgi:hypothetical protein
MALIPAFERLLLEVRKSFGLSDQKTAKGKSKFLLIDEDFVSHGELYKELKHDLLEHLELSPEDSSAMDTQFLSMAQHITNISQQVFTRSLSQPQVSWLMATHSIAPGLARIAAYWQLQDIMDKGMPSGSFWYLPEIEGDSIVLPFTQVLRWLTHLIDDTHGLDSLIDDIYGHDNEQGKSSNHNSDKASIRKNLKNWQTKSGASKTAKTVNDYFDDNIKINYRNTFDIDKNLPIKEQIIRAKEYLKKNNLNTSTIGHEFNIGSITDLKKILNFQGSDEQNLGFICAMQARFEQPSNKTLRYRFKIALAMQDMYLRFGKHLHGKEFQAISSDSETNKTVQILFLFKSIYNLVYKVETEINPSLSLDPQVHHQADKVVDEALNKQYPHYLTMGIQKTGGKAVEAILSDFLNYAAVRLEESSLPSVVAPANHSSSQDVSLYEEITFEMQNLQTEEAAIHLGHMDQDSCEIPYSLISIIKDNNLHPDMRQKAISRATANIQAFPFKLYAPLFEANILFFDEMRQVQNKIFENSLEELLHKKIKETGHYEHNKALYLYLKARTLFYKKYFKNSKNLFEDAVKASKTINSGNIRGLAASYCFMINAATKPNGYNLDSQKKYYRDMIMFGGMPQSLYMKSPTEHSDSWLLKVNKGIDFEFTPPIEEVEKILIKEFNLAYI